MAENSAIEWTNHTFNPWWGCTAVSAGCDHCYAENLDRRTGGSHWVPGTARRRTGAKNWHQPLKWNRTAQANGVRARVFCASMADVFDNQVPPEWRADLWQLIRDTPHLDWQLLTKRPQNIRKMLPDDWGDGYANVWLGTTTENQPEADRRIIHLISIPARVRFLSCEPLIGRVDPACITVDGDSELNALKPHRWEDEIENWRGTSHDWVEEFEEWYGCQPDKTGPMHNRIDWVICGGESGPGARPMDIEWARLLRDRCADAGVAFFMKQMGGLKKPFPPIPDDLMVRQFPGGAS